MKIGYKYTAVAVGELIRGDRKAVGADDLHINCAERQIDDSANGADDDLHSVVIALFFPLSDHERKGYDVPDSVREKSYTPYCPFP